MKYNRYHSPTGQKVYRPSFCAYFDILGFSDKIKNEDLKFFERYLKILDNELKYLDDRHDLNNKQNYKKFELKIFTDNFVLGYPWDDQFGEIELGYLHEVLSHIQFNFIKYGIFVKGAISYSNLYMNENIVLGKALIDAYQLEEKESVYPRIILSPEVKEIVKNHLSFYGNDFHSPQNKQYLLDKDGYFFVNYLYNLIDDSMEYKGFEDFASIFVDVQIHKNSVIAELKKHKANNRVFEKFAWIANYHNYFCNNFLDKSKYDLKKLLINKKLYEKKIERCV